LSEKLVDSSNCSATHHKETESVVQSLNTQLSALNSNFSDMEAIREQYTGFGEVNNSLTASLLKKEEIIDQLREKHDILLSSEKQLTEKCVQVAPTKENIVNRVT
jgi:chromosome segregation ATPase